MAELWCICGQRPPKQGWTRCHLCSALNDEQYTGPEFTPVPLDQLLIDLPDIPDLPNFEYDADRTLKKVLSGFLCILFGLGFICGWALCKLL